jgi:proteasome alpha subunit
VSMPFYVSPEQIMRDKADYAASRIARIRSCVALQYTGGILMVAPNPSTSRHKISELYDRIAFAAGGRYNEYEALRKAGVTYADITGYQFDRRDVTGLGLANWYAQTLGTIFTDSTKPYEVEIVVAEVGMTPDNDQIYRITFDGSVSDEPGFVAFGGQADQVSARLKERFHDGMSLAEALGAALDALTAPNTNNQSSAGTSASTAGNGQPAELTASQLEVAILDRARAHRTFRRLRGPRLEELLAESRAAAASASGDSDSADSGSGSASAEAGSGSGSGDSGAADSGPSAPSGPSSPSSGPDEPPTGPTAGGSDGIPRPPL